MIYDANQWLEAPSFTNYDTVIFGAGAAGITLALRLAGHGKRVLLCESGGLEITNESQEVYEGQVIGDPYLDLTTCRLRYFGGTTNHWGGWCRTFEAIDFEREYLGPDYAWPISKADLDPYLAPACEILEIPTQFEDRPLTPDIRGIQFNFSPPVRFALKYKGFFDSSDHVDLILNANLTGLTGSPRVQAATCMNYAGQAFDVSGKSFAFAMGGIENSRQMLWLSQQLNTAIAPTLPIGRYWMEHPHFTLGEALVETQRAQRTFYALSAKKQRDLNILNGALRVHAFPSSSQTKELLRDLLCTAPKAGAWMMHQVGRGLACGATFRAAWEQAPVASNRVTLSATDKDRFGTPKTVLHWTKSDLDRRTLLATVDTFNRFIQKENIGRMRLAPWLANGGDYPENDELAGSHHMGGTRMAVGAEYGVVDRNCRVFGTDNLYVAGSSIFTTGGHNNPTLPIVQFALRLGDHLATTKLALAR